MKRILSYFNIECGPGNARSVEQVFNMMTLENNKCISRRAGGKLKSIIAYLNDVQIGLRKQLDAMAAMVASKDAKISGR